MSDLQQQLTDTLAKLTVAERRLRLDEINKKIEAEPDNDDLYIEYAKILMSRWPR